ncbi:hypothetical protein GCM10009555_054260 [Acrocarpospora macrocephala]|uniref:Integral membrane protein n=1 Tax=Acrocarpospora macrocephala TaxID=150177 RepID=A0A5M3X8A8_9ACTN|nr:hypothetical protein Amac_080150 [Acrocarpospora macrocephala]
MIGLGALLVLMGAVWTLQGLGFIGGSFMSDNTTWAIIGPIVVIVGLALAVWAARRKT